MTCPTCHGLFRPRANLPEPSEEKARYEEHENDLNDERYRGFVSPIVDRVREDFSMSHNGLDFGSGTVPIVAHVLQESGYQVAPYDPFFCNEPALLDRQYDYITCSEVIEHFHDPAAEFVRLKAMLTLGGKLYCMTALYHEGIDFTNWHYRRDLTHVFIYQRETIEWIAQAFDFADVSIEGRLIIFSG